jgi:hypothetical protein
VRSLFPVRTCVFFPRVRNGQAVSCRIIIRGEESLPVAREYGFTSTSPRFMYSIEQVRSCPVVGCAARSDSNSKSISGHFVSLPERLLERFSTPSLVGVSPQPDKEGGWTSAFGRRSYVIWKARSSSAPAEWNACNRYAAASCARKGNAA